VKPLLVASSASPILLRLYREEQPRAVLDVDSAHFSVLRKGWRNADFQRPARHPETTRNRQEAIVNETYQM
jgi:hypothetical protein